MNHWPTQSLGELLVALESGSRPKGGVGEIVGGIPSLGGEHVNRDGGFTWVTPKHVTREFYAGMKRGRIKCGDILVVKDGATTGKTATVRENFPFSEAAVNEHVFLLRADRAKVLSEFVGYFLFGPVGQQQILSSFHGAAIGGITQDFVRNVFVPVPPLAEQERIVKLLDEADELRKLRAQADHRTADIIPALFYEMFGKAEQNAKKWPVKAIGDVCTLVRGSSPRPKSDPRYYGGPIPRLMIEDITRDGWSVTPRVDSLTELGATMSRPVKAGTIVMAVSGNVGLCAQLAIDACVHDGFVAFKDLRASVLLPVFFGMAMSQMHQAHQRNKAGAIFQNITTTDVKAMKISVPPLSLQKEFTARVSEIRAMETEQAASRECLEALFQSLLHRAFNEEL